MHRNESREADYWMQQLLETTQLLHDYYDRYYNSALSRTELDLMMYNVRMAHLYALFLEEALANQKKPRRSALQRFLFRK